MSTTQLYAIDHTGDVYHFGDANNSWQGGMHVWRKLSDKYGHEDNLFTEFKKTWGNFNTGYYESYEDIVLGASFDYVTVKKKDFKHLINAMRLYLAFHEDSNFDQQIDIIESMQADETIIGLAWCQTSVVDYLWDYDYNEDTGKLIHYNINKGSKHWDLFERLEGHKNE